MGAGLEDDGSLDDIPVINSGRTEHGDPSKADMSVTRLVVPESELKNDFWKETLQLLTGKLKEDNIEIS